MNRAQGTGVGDVGLSRAASAGVTAPLAGAMAGVGLAVAAVLQPDLLAGATGAAAVAIVAALVLRRCPARLPVSSTPPRAPRALTGPAAAVERRRALRRERREMARDLPEVVEAMARAVRAGSSIRGAVAATAAGARGAAGADMAHLAARLDRGVPLPTVLDEWRVRRADVHEVALVAATLQIAADAGGSVAQALDGVADTIRSRRHLHAEIGALASQAEASAVLIAALPLAFAAVAGAADPAMLAFLIATPLGLVCLCAGIALDVAGLVWMHHITTRIEG